MAGSSHQGDGMVTGINVTPLVDITLVLLIIMMVTSKIISTPALTMDLPRAAHTEEVQMILSVIVPMKGPTLVNGAALNDDALVAEAKRLKLTQPDLRAVVHAEGDVQHRRVIHVLDLLQQAGVAHVGFAALPMEPSTP